MIELHVLQQARNLLKVAAVPVPMSPPVHVAVPPLLTVALGLPSAREAVARGRIRIAADLDESWLAEVDANAANEFHLRGALARTLQTCGALTRTLYAYNAGTNTVGRMEAYRIDPATCLP
mgnify:CR=1 FL=1